MRSEYAAQLWTLLDKYESSVRHTAYIPSNMPDFSYFDRPIQTHSEQNISNQNIQSEQNQPTKTTPTPTSPQTRQIIDVATGIASCRKCSIAANTRNKVPGQGAIPAKIMVVSFYTDDEAENTMYPLSGNVLNQFSKWLGAIKLSLSDVYVTNLIKCNPHNQSINKNFVENCLFHLDNEMKIINPVIILTLGSTVVSSLCQRYVDINMYHGQMLNYRGFPVFPTFHPTDVLSNPYLRKPVWDDLQRFRAVFDNILREPGYHFE